jgi:hypothetical protein
MPEFRHLEDEVARLLRQMPGDLKRVEKSVVRFTNR